MTDKDKLAEALDDALAYCEAKLRQSKAEGFKTIAMLSKHVETLIEAANRAEQLEKLAYYDVLSDDGETILERHEYRRLLVGCKSERDQLEEENALQRLTIEAHNDAILRYQERVRELEAKLEAAKGLREEILELCDSENMGALHILDCIRETIAACDSVEG